MAHLYNGQNDTYCFVRTTGLFVEAKKKTIETREMLLIATFIEVRV